ncbi:MAG: hypothetical protein KDA65_02880 [Planctomycetaceae bacterium]|nr:hypothetical protein [Planctomycetaceae bacterium]
MNFSEIIFQIMLLVLPVVVYLVLPIVAHWRIQNPLHRFCFCYLAGVVGGVLLLISANVAAPEVPVGEETDTIIWFALLVAYAVSLFLWDLLMLAGLAFLDYLWTRYGGTKIETTEG